MIQYNNRNLQASNAGKSYLTLNSQLLHNSLFVCDRCNIQDCSKGLVAEIFSLKA